MSHPFDESKPTTGHHPSCRESDKDLVWHCNQCGLNESAADIEAKLDQPEPADEWTNVDGVTIDFGDGDTVQITERLVTKMVVEKHSAALAAAYKKGHDDGYAEAGNGLGY